MPVVVMQSRVGTMPVLGLLGYLGIRPGLVATRSIGVRWSSVSSLQQKCGNRWLC